MQDTSCSFDAGGCCVADGWSGPSAFGTSLGRHDDLAPSTSTCRDDAAQPRCSSGPMLPFTAILHHVVIPQIYEEGTSSVHTEHASGTLSVAINSLPSPRPCSLETKRCARGNSRSWVINSNMCDEWKASWCAIVSLLLVVRLSSIVRSLLLNFSLLGYARLRFPLKFRGR